MSGACFVSVGVAMIYTREGVSSSEIQHIFSLKLNNNGKWELVMVYYEETKMKTLIFILGIFGETLYCLSLNWHYYFFHQHL